MTTLEIGGTTVQPIATPKAMKRSIYDIGEDIYCTHVTIVVNCDFPSFVKWLKRHTNEDLSDLGEYEAGQGLHIGIKNKSGQPSHAIWIKHFDWTIPDMGVLAHELIHFIMAVLHQKRIPIRQENDEVFAYLYEYYFTQAFRKLNPKGKARKKRR